MRLSFISLVVTLATATSFGAEGFRLGLVDLQKALQTVDAGRNAKKSLEKEVTAKREGLEKRQSELQKEAEGFEKKSALLNEGAKTKKQQELQKKFMELQKRERELTKPIIDELRGVIESIGKEKGLTLILERNEGAVLFSQGEEDLTEQVIEKFNSSSKRVGKKNN